jgi:hypothetical protein
MVKISLQALTQRDRSQRIGRQLRISSVVVPSGSLQVENGFLETSSQGQSVVDGPESLVRFGITKRTELRFTAPDYFLNTGGPRLGIRRLCVRSKKPDWPHTG